MSYRGKLEERTRARELRAQAWTLNEIAEHLGVSKSSVSIWVRDVDFTPRPRSSRRYGARPPGSRRHRQQEAKLAQIAHLKRVGREVIGRLSEREFLVAGVALYAGEGAKRDGEMKVANTDPRILLFYVSWLRRFFDIDESRLRVRLYLHQGLDLEAAEAFWSHLLEIPRSQFRTPYRAVPDAGIRHTKHVFGCPAVRYGSVEIHRTIVGLMEALLDPGRAPPEQLRLLGGPSSPLGTLPTAFRGSSTG